MFPQLRFFLYCRMSTITFLLLVLSQQTLLQESSKRPESRNKKYFTEGISKVLS